jgi:hypothetical protein
LVDKFPDGYDDSNIISFRNAKMNWLKQLKYELKTLFI